MARKTVTRRDSLRLAQALRSVTLPTPEVRPSPDDAVVLSEALARRGQERTPEEELARLRRIGRAFMKAARRRER